MKKTKPRRSIYFKAIAGAVTMSDDPESNDCFGYLAGYGNVDDGEDLLIKGCCAKSIQERGPNSSTARKIAMLCFHDQRVPAGRFTKLEEQDKGLYYEGTLDTVPYIQHTIKPQLKSKTINQHSIGYNYVWDKIEWDEDKKAFIVKELDLFEGSFVTLGMNENTAFGGFKKWYESRDDFRDLDERAEKILKKMKNQNSELELRNILQKYQSLLDGAAEEITAMKKKPTIFDYKYIANNF